MGFWGAVGGALSGAGIGFVASGFNPLGALAGAAIGLGGEEMASDLIGGAKPDAPDLPAYPDPVDYSAAMVVESDNNKTVALAQIQSQEFAMQQASIDRQLQAAANLELGIEKLDTKLQVSKLDFVVQMTAEADKHQEKMAKIFSTNSNYDGLPPPETEEKA